MGGGGGGAIVAKWRVGFKVLSAVDLQWMTWREQDTDFSNYAPASVRAVRTCFR